MALPLDDDKMSLRQFLLPVVIPGMLQGKSGSAVTPLLPIFVSQDLHGSHTAVGIVSAAYGLSAVCCSPFLGLLLRRCHYTTAACLSLSLLVATALLSYLAPSVATIFIIRFVGGAGAATYDLSRKTFMSHEVPNSMRGKVSGLLAGMQKLAIMVGALIGGSVAEHLSTRCIFLVQALFSGSALAITAGHQLYQAMFHTLSLETSSTPCDKRECMNAAACRGETRARASLHVVAKEYARDFIGAGGYCSMLVGLRNTWLILLPLHTASVGLSKQSIGLAVALVRGVDAFGTLMYSGHIVDKFGTHVACIAGNLLMACGFFFLPFTTGLSSIVLVGCVYGVGNSMTGGIVNVFATSLAPVHARTEFLGIWKMTTALGQLLLPPLFGVVADELGSLGRAAFLMSAIALFSVAWLLLVVKDHSVQSTASADALNGAT
eukprot:TRINITY_DN16212_c0_g1_i1.p1 TRINITY_DN16212_c0_g1~~TRINITY_DN16212_c0_g1_i1.p1  ORF type:complete len:434 (-),score=45.67 TRINITY_DN16212_c0_g1_i1:44-1345(-)